MNFKNMETIRSHNECQILYDMTDVRSARPYYVDLRKYADGKTVLENPHKGWFWHYVDNGFRREGVYWGTDTYEDVAGFPCLNHLYIRFDWSDVEKEKGIYDFSRIDEIMEIWGKKGYTFSMRACTYETDLPFVTPRYVFEEGAKCYLIENEDGSTRVIQPDYADPIYFHYLEKFMKAYGEKYNGDPRVEYIDVGTYGTWGEGHTICGEERIYPIEVIKKHFDLHTKYFPDTYILCNDDHIMGVKLRGEEGVLDLLEYADARGFGLQDDSVCVSCYGELYNSLRAPWLFDRLQENAPCVIELDHYGTVKHAARECFRDGLTVIEALKDAHATFAGFHGYPKEWLSDQKYLTEYCANRLGYWYFLVGVIVPPLTTTAHNRVVLEVENRGWARAYHRYDLKLMLRSDEGEEYIIEAESDNRQWKAGEKSIVRCFLDCREIPEGEYEFSIGLFEKERPILLALDSRRYHEGFYTVCHTTVKG